MAESLGIILICGILANTLATKLKLPGLIGMLLAGIAIGPFGFGLLTSEAVTSLGDFRKIALIIILLRAGLGLKKEMLAQVGSSAIKMSFIPGLVEGFSIAAVASTLLHIPFIEACMLGFILAAVSPAVVVPKMISLVEQRKGGKLPTLILAGASADNIMAVTLFSAVIALASGTNKSVGTAIAMIPVSFISGVIVGVIVGFSLAKIFTKWSIRDTNKVITLLGISFLMIAIQNHLKGIFEIAMLPGIMVTAFILLETVPEKANRIAKKLSKLWIGAEIVLFVLVGAQVDPSAAVSAGGIGVAIIAIGLITRSAGVLISLAGSGFSLPEKLFSVVSYLPKASVQAAIGAVPLEMGFGSGNTILAIAILSILITSPLGSIGISALAPKCLKEN